MFGKLFIRTITVTLAVCITSALLLTLPRHDTRNDAPVAPQPFCTLLPSSVQYVQATDTVPWVGVGRKWYWDKKQIIRIYFEDGLTGIKRKVVSIASVWAALSGL